MDIKDYWTGMQEWKIKQEIFHRLNKDHRDDLTQVDIVLTENIVEDALRHFKERVGEWIYPSKSYFVAICYAHWIAQDYNEDFYTLLDDELLLAGNDPYFVPYSEDKETYDKILSKVTFPLEMVGMIGDVREYYDEEIGFE